jgi:hypothetical protein
MHGPRGVFSHGLRVHSFLERELLTCWYAIFWLRVLIVYLTIAFLPQMTETNKIRILTYIFRNSIDSRNT